MLFLPCGPQVRLRAIAGLFAGLATAATLPAAYPAPSNGQPHSAWVNQTLDTLVYPDFTYAGLAEYGGRIPSLPVRATVNPGGNDRANILAAIHAAAAQGGGTVQLGSGTFNLDDVIFIPFSNIVIKGAGRNATIVRLNSVNTTFSRSRLGVFHFEGEGNVHNASGSRIESSVAQTANRGAMSVTVNSAAGFQTGDYVQIRRNGPPAEYANRYRTWDANATFYVDTGRITAINGNTLSLAQPLRIPLTAGSSSVRLQRFLFNVGVEDLTIDTLGDWNTYGVNLRRTWGSWVRNVSILRPGSYPLDFGGTKHAYVTNVYAENPRNVGSGAHGYGGVLGGNDVLWENVEMLSMRHAPNLQAYTTGTVIRNSTFLDSDGQWHHQFPSENLLENIYIDQSNSSAAVLWNPGLDSDLHTPPGPRNVIYYSDFTTEGRGISLNGGHIDWTVAYNRVRIGGRYGTDTGYWKAATVVLGDYSDGITFRNNTFINQNQSGATNAGGVWFRPGYDQSILDYTASSPAHNENIRFVNNRFHLQNQPLTDSYYYGFDTPNVSTGNTLLAYNWDAPRPTPPQASLYVWQYQQKYNATPGSHNWNSGPSGRTLVSAPANLLPVAVTATSTDGNRTPDLTLDELPYTFWRTTVLNAAITFDLGVATSLTSVRLAWNDVGSSRQYRFDVQVSANGTNWTTVLANGVGATTGLAEHTFVATTGRYLRIVNRGNTASSDSMNLAEAEIYGSPAGGSNPPPPPPPPGDPSGAVLSVASVTATASQTGNTPANTIDGSLSTRWAADNQPQSITYTLPASSSVTGVKIAWYNGNSRTYTFRVEVGSGGAWSTVLNNHVSSGTTAGLETYTFNATTGTQVRITGLGNSSSFPTWTSISETQIWGNAGSNPPPPPPPPSGTVLAWDDFEGAGWNTGSGWTSNWTRVGDTGRPTTGAFEGARCAVLTNIGSITRTTDLSGASAAYLHLAWRANSLEAGESAVIEVFDGNWHTVRTITPAEADDSWNDESYPLGGYNLGAGFQLRFRVLGNATNDRFFVDAIEISQ